MQKSVTKFSESDAVMIITEWQEFFNLDYTGKLVIDGRKVNKAGREADYIRRDLLVMRAIQGKFDRL